MKTEETTRSTFDDYWAGSIGMSVAKSVAAGDAKAIGGTDAENKQAGEEYQNSAAKWIAAQGESK